MAWVDRLWRLAGLAVVIAVLAGGGVALTRPDGTTPPHPTLIATADRHHVDVYRHKGGDHVWKHLRSPNAQGAPLVFLVADRRPRWLKVLLPVRPNDAIGWVRADQVSLSTTRYRIDVWLHAHRVVVHRGRQTVVRAPAAVGKRATPTPTGRFYLTSLLRPPDPHGAYGPYAFGLSAYSDVIFHFGGGPGQIGLHGTDEPRLLGRSVSHGCIRISNAHIAKLAHLLPLGTPVVVHG